MADEREKAMLGLFQAWSLTYDSSVFQDNIYRPLHSVMQPRLRVLAPNAKTVLDIGIGTGESLSWLQSTYERVVGVDVSSDMLAFARGKREANAVLVKASAMALPLADSSVDAVVSCMSVHWWPDIGLGWREVRRVLRAGGGALFVLPSSALLALPAVRARWQRPGVAATWISPKTHAKFAREAGFRVGLPVHIHSLAWLLECRL